jgi:XTP/dITP diphosphohydrolase
MTARVLLATRNAAKLTELQRILAGSGVTLVGLAGVPPYPERPETGATFTANAVAKATAGAEATGLVTVADDSGLAVDALGGMPGLLSARWSGRHGDDPANLDLVLGQLADVPLGRREAAFYCAAAAVTPGGQVVSTVGVVRGSLTREARGSNGFGYDPIFLPWGETRTTAEMGSAQKDAISHRGIAFRSLAPLLVELVAGH